MTTQTTQDDAGSETAKPSIEKISYNFPTEDELRLSPRARHDWSDEIEFEFDDSLKVHAEEDNYQVRLHLENGLTIVFRWETHGDGSESLDRKVKDGRGQEWKVLDSFDYRKFLTDEEIRGKSLLDKDSDSVFENTTEFAQFVEAEIREYRNNPEYNPLEEVEE